MDLEFDFDALDTQIEADWPVEVSVPKDGGKTEIQKLNVRYRLLSDAELEAVNAPGKDSAREAMRLAIVGFGKDTKREFTPAALEKMLSKGYVRLALNRAYGGFSMGIPAKNSEALAD